MDAFIDSGTWCMPPIFNWIQQKGNIDIREMFRTFNCGVGMVVCVPATDQDTALKCLAKSGESAWIIGKIKTGQKDQSRVALT
jgi:phosphoribosylformylglycinamidine cyclo-ligase